MSSSLSEKLKEIRKAESLSQTEFCEITGISISTIKKYETGILEPGGGTLMKITNNPRFKKYTMWLMADEIAPEINQISPSLSPNGQKGILTNQKKSKAG